MLLFQFAVYGWAALLFTTTRLLPVNYFVSGYQVPSTTVIQNRALTNPNNSNSQTPAVSFANVIAKNEVVDVSFTDGSTFRFHSLWLRDACRDAHHVAAQAGEKILTATPVGPSGICPIRTRANMASVNDDTGLLHIIWNDDSFIEHELAIDPPTVSTFPAQFLRTYANVVAECLVPPTTMSEEEDVDATVDEFAFLAPYSGFPGARAPSPNDITPWRANELQRQDEDDSIFPSFNYSDILDPNSDTNLHAIQTMLNVGCIIIDGCSDEDAGEGALHHLADTAFGGLQKDPTRDIANWKIVKKDGATSISYDSLKRLNQHTDSSIPPHGIPALCLLMHYAEGSGTNTFTDGYAVAKQLQIENPEGYALLAQYGCDAERDFVASRVDSPQEFNRGLIVSTQYKIIQLDDIGNLVRIQYNEVFRTPLTLPHDIFPKWYAAFHRFVELIHDDEYEVKVPMKKGRFMLMNNWRILHGRAGGAASSNRILVGGTITRESIYSQSRRLLREQKNRRHAAIAATVGEGSSFTPDTSQEEEVMIRGRSHEVEAATQYV